MTQRVFSGYGAIEKLADILSEYAVNRIFLVTGGRSYTSCGANRTLERILAGYAVTRFSGFEVNPKLEDVLKGVDLFSSGKHECVVAIGGGTVIDMAKMVNIFARHTHHPLEYIEGRQKIETGGSPLVACPTTAGTGSEATHFAVVYVGKTKHSVGHPAMRPDAAIVDPQFLARISRPIAAATGMDALCQAIESYWSIYSTEVSKSKSGQAIRLIVEHLPIVVDTAAQEGRLAVATGAHLAGEAINITKTTAAHAVSYPITSYFGIPHGHAVGLILPAMFAFNARVTDADVLDQRGAEYVRKTIAELADLVGARDADDAGRILERFMDTIGLNRDFHVLGIRTRDDIETIVRNGFNPERVNNNPRRVSEDAMRTMLDQLQNGCRLPFSG